jgi:methylisocitrate lyase
MIMTPRNSQTAGQRLRAAVDEERPLQVVGTVNAMCALMADRAGFRAIYLSGAGVANASHGLPDLGVTTLHDVLEDARRITAVTNTPLLVDVDTCWDSQGMTHRVVRELIRAEAAGLHLEDQIDAKRCGHRPGKQLVTASEMKDRLKAALDARTDPDFVVTARTDAAGVEGLEAAIERANQYAEVGADMIFAEALTSLDDYRRFAAAIEVPVLANMTEFGRTPLLTVEELCLVGVRVVLYPLTAFRAMNAAAMLAYQTIRTRGTQSELIDSLQTRDELYDLLDYYAKERALRQE